MPQFGWLSPVAGHQGSNYQPIVTYQAEHILPAVTPFFDSVWIADHFYGFDRHKTEGFLEAWTTVSWLAGKFDDVSFCHHVLGQGYRNPALTAKMAASLQYVTGNRFMLGIGAGWRGDEFKSYGYDFPGARVRLQQLEETVQICHAMWTQPHPSFEGQYFRIDDAAAPPRPEVVPEVCIGSAGEKIGLPIVGRRADLWNTSELGEVDYRRKRGVVDAAATAFGRDPGEITSCLTLSGDLPETDAQSQQWVERLGRWIELGVGYFVLDFGHPLQPQPALRFCEQVIPACR